MMETDKKIGKTPSIRRLPLYLNRLMAFKERGISIVTSSDLAVETGLLPVVVKKDLQLVEPPTKKRMGYHVDGTIEAIQSFLNWDRPTYAVLVGAGHLGSALLGYKGFTNLDFLAAFDVNPNKIGTSLHGISVLDVEALPDFLKAHSVHVAILTTPSDVAQEMADKLVSFGIPAIWNFTPAKLHVPATVALQREDLSAGLAELSAKMKINQ